MATDFLSRFKSAKEYGYSDDEIINAARDMNIPEKTIQKSMKGIIDERIEKAREYGYSDEQITESIYKMGYPGEYAPIKPTEKEPSLRPPGKFDVIEPTRPAIERGADIAASKMAISMAGGPQAIEKTMQRQKQGKWVARRAPMSGLLYTNPWLAVGFEGLQQIKNVVVPQIKGQKWSSLEDRIISELIPDKYGKTRIAAGVGEMALDVAIVGGLQNLAFKAKGKLLNQSIKIAGKKLEQAGYGKDKMEIPPEEIAKALKKTTLGNEIKRLYRVAKKDYTKKPLLGKRRPFVQHPAIGEETPKTPTVGATQEIVPKTPIAQHPSIGVNPEATIQPQRVTPIQTIVGELNRMLSNNRGMVDTSAISQPVEKVVETGGKVADAFTRFRGLSPEMREKAIAVDEAEPIIRRQAIKTATDLLGKFDANTRKELQYALEENTMLPPGTQEAANKVMDIQNWALEQRKTYGYEIAKWPQNQIDALKQESKNLEYKYKHDPKSKEAVVKKIDAINKRVEKLEKLKYVHRVTTPQKGLRAMIKRHKFRQIISDKPYHFLNRKFDTVRDAERAGYKVGDLMVSVGETIYDTMMEGIKHDFIESINKNPELSAPESKAPATWKKIDTRLMPKAARKAYHPSIANALKELTWKDDTHVLVRAYDMINTAGKMIGFYNPLIMAKNDLFQGWRAAGLRFFSNMPKAIKMYLNNDPKIEEWGRQGLFNNVIDYRPAITEMIEGIIENESKSKPLIVLENAIRKPLQSLYSFNNKTTWEMDRILRIACRLGIDNQYVTDNLSPFQKTEMANDFMANYGKVPKRTRQVLNRVVFTPTYKISMARVLGQMWSSPKQYHAPLLRHYAYINFIRYVLPAIASSYVMWRYKKEIKSWAEGYRIVLKDDKGEKVISLSDPILEMTKVMNRSPRATVYFNLAFLPQFALQWLHQKGAKDFAKSDLQRANEYFKIGAPVLRDIMIWMDHDKSAVEKWMMQIGVAYIYIRSPYKYKDKDHGIGYKILESLDMMPTWMKSKEEKERIRYEKDYQYYSAEWAKYYRAGDKKNQGRIEQEVMKKYGVPLIRDKADRKRIVKDIFKRKRMTKDEYMLDKSGDWIKRVMRKEKK